MLVGPGIYDKSVHVHHLVPYVSATACTCTTLNRSRRISRVPSGFSAVYNIDNNNGIHPVWFHTRFTTGHKVQTRCTHSRHRGLGAVT